MGVITIIYYDIFNWDRVTDFATDFVEISFDNNY